MNSRIKKRWIEKLTSGKYKQGVGALRSRDNKDRHEFCCLGVLCDMFIKSKAGKAAGAKWEKVIFSKNDEFRIGNVSVDSYPPSAVLDWAGLKEENPTIETKNNSTHLATLNDGDLSSYNPVKRHSFKQIAKIIEKNL